MFIFIISILISSFNILLCQQNCGKSFTSTCSDDSITTWNTHDIERNLKNWIRSIQQVPLSSKRHKWHLFVQKALHDSELSSVQFITRNRCKKHSPIGPLWKKASMFSGTQFHDGYLYTEEYDEGNMTGNCISLPIL